MTTTLIKLPVEIICGILKYTNVLTLSKMCCVNKMLSDVIKDNKWAIMDNFRKPPLNQCIPRNEETYKSYRYCIDFPTLILDKKKLQSCTIQSNAQHIDFSLLSEYQQLPDDILRTFYENIPLQKLLTKQVLPTNLLEIVLEKFCDSLDSSLWSNVCKFQKLSVKLIKKYHQYMEWISLSQNKHVVTVEFINTFQDKIIWQELTNLGLHENLIKECECNLNEVCFWNISFSSKLSKHFMKQHFDKLYPSALCAFQKLDEELILRIVEQDEQQWAKIAECQHLSIEFMQKYKSFLPKHLLIRNKNIKRQHLKDIFS